MLDDIIVFTGGFDPIHSGHIAAIKEAQKLGKVVIGINSDEWLVRKKGRAFMPFEERKILLEQFKDIIAVIGFDDSDGSGCDAIQQAKDMFPDNKIVFVNGGDRTKGNIPEINRFKEDPRVSFAFSTGGDTKKNSSSWILSEWANPSEERIWGSFTTYHSSPEAKIKRLIIKPGKSISMQYHNKRAEFWFIEQGEGTVYSLLENTEYTKNILNKHKYCFIERAEWHRIENTSKEDLHIIEIQYGEACIEEDIVRK